MQQIKDCIGQGSPHYALVFINKLFETAKKAAAFPQIGRKVPEFDRDDIRELIYRNYRIIYHLQDDVITILTVIHGTRILKGDTLNND
jgi:plasmid stabilization system protein ParE